MNELLAFGRFEVGRLVRSWKFLVITVGFPVTFYMLFLSDRRAGEVIAGTVPWRVYLMVSMCSFGALVAALTAGGARLSTERASGWARQLRVTPLPAWAYVVTKVGASMLVILPVIGLVDVVGASFGGVHLSLPTWIAMSVAMWLTALPFAVLGVFIGFMVNAETAFPVVTALMFVIGYFGGLFNPVASMPRPLRMVAQVLPSFRHAAVGLSVVDGRGRTAADLLVLAGYTAALGIAVALKHRHEEARGIAAV
jgi:ABC-2 type transport system permease protein